MLGKFFQVTPTGGLVSVGCYYSGYSSFWCPELFAQTDLHHTRTGWYRIPTRLECSLFDLKVIAHLRNGACPLHI